MQVESNKHYYEMEGHLMFLYTGVLHPSSMLQPLPSWSSVSPRGHSYFAWLLEKKGQGHLSSWCWEISVQTPQNGQEVPELEDAE